MKIYFKHKNKAKRANLAQESYHVLAYGDFGNDLTTFLIANDELKILEFDQSSVEIIDHDLSNYTRRDDLNYDNMFYINSKLNQLRDDIENYAQLKSASIWNLSKNYRFFKENNYCIPKFYKNYVLNEAYKLALIEGFLIFANDYINSKFDMGNHSQILSFYKAQNLELLLKEKTKDIQFFDIERYPEILKNFISGTLWDREQEEDKSEKHRLQFFKLIDSLFLKDISSIRRLTTPYNNSLIIEYNKNYYILSKF